MLRMKKLQPGERGPVSASEFGRHTGANGKAGAENWMFLVFISVVGSVAACPEDVLASKFDHQQWSRLLFQAMSGIPDSRHQEAPCQARPLGNASCSFQGANPTHKAREI